MRTVTIGTIWLALAVAACGEAPAPPGNAVTPSPTPAPPPTTTAAVTMPAPVTPAAKASITKESTRDYDFAFSYPAEAAAIPPLAASLDADRTAARAGVAKDAAADRRERAKGDFPFHKYETTIAWKRVAQTPRFLSLSAETYGFTGGAHGNPGFDSLVWDRGAEQRLATTDVFASPAAIQAAIGEAFCAALDVQRAKRRGAPVVRSGDGFNDCPKVAETTLILGSTNGRAIDRIGLLVGPYVAGPFAEGSYDLTLPVTPALLRAVKPAYREAFAVKG